MPKIYQDFTNSINVPIVLDSLANGDSVASSTIDNSVTLYISANVQFEITLGTSIAGGTLTVYILRSVDGGVSFDDLNSNSEILGVFNADDTMASTAIKFSIDTNVVGTLPDYWRVAVTNNSGDALDATPANHSVTMTGKLLLIQ